MAVDFHRMRCFLAVADLLHFSRAAERIHISQPALSTQILRLEAEIGAKLFERSHHKITLTYAGLVYRDEVREILAEADRAVSRTRLANEGRIGRIRISFISTAAAYLIPPLISEFRETHPKVELELNHHLTARQIELLQDDAIDIGFFRIPVPDHRGLEVIPIHKEPFKLFVPLSHPLAARPIVDLDELGDAAFVIYGRRNAPGFHELVADILRKAHARPATTHEASDMYTLVSLVSAGLGITIAPASLENYHLPNIAVREIAHAPQSEIAVAFREDMEHAAARAFLDLTRERAARTLVAKEA